MANYGIKKIFQTKLTANELTDVEGIGCLRFEGNKVYKWVKYNSGAGPVAAVAGNVVYYYGASGVGTVGYDDCVVTMDLTDAVLGAGVLQAILTNGYYGWIQVRGPATLTTALTAGADGNALTIVGTTDGTLDVSALVTDHICAYAFDASAKIISCEFPF